MERVKNNDDGTSVVFLQNEHRTSGNACGKNARHRRSDTLRFMITVEQLIRGYTGRTGHYPFRVSTSGGLRK